MGKKGGDENPGFDPSTAREASRTRSRMYPSVNPPPLSANFKTPILTGWCFFWGMKNPRVRAEANGRDRLRKFGATTKGSGNPPSPPVFVACDEDWRGEVSTSARKSRRSRPKTTALATPPRRAKEKQHLMRYCVYILESRSFPDRFYTGFTQDLRKRLEYHNAGTVPATKPYIPWTIKTYISFSDEQSARDFERYLKTHSGRAFAKNGCNKLDCTV